MIRRSNSRICAFNLRNWVPSAATHARASSGTRLSLGSATILQFLYALASDRSNDPELGKMRPDHIDHRSLLTDEQWRVRCSVRQLCCSGVLVATNRISLW